MTSCGITSKRKEQVTSLSGFGEGSSAETLWAGGLELSAETARMNAHCRPVLNTMNESEKKADKVGECRVHLIHS